MDDPVALALKLDEEHARRLLELLGARSALREFRRACATRYAVDMLRRGEKDRAVIRDRLIVRYGISRSLAYECLDVAVDEFAKSSRFTPRSWTQTSEDSSIATNENDA